MESSAVKIKKQHIFNMALVDVVGHYVLCKEVSGKMLMERKEFIKYCTSRSTADRLVNAGLLTSYHENGTPKERGDNGRLPSTTTYYCVKQWRNLDYNQI